MDVLITGGAGFIGSHVADLCISRGDRVTVVDDLSTGRIENIAHLLANPRFRYVAGNVTDAVAMRKLVGACDGVYHLAAAIGMRYVVASPLNTLKTNVFGTEVILEAASLLGKRVLFTSTSDVYGLNEHKPSAETDLCVLGGTSKSRWSYAYSKAAGEALAMAYHSERKLPVTIARLFNTIGPRQSGQYGMVVPTFVRQALTGESLTVHGDGTQTRCFIDVRRVADALVKLLNHPRAAGEIVNLGSASEISIGDLAHRIIKRTKSASRVAFVSHNAVYERGFDEIKRRLPDISKARALIGFDPATNLDGVLDELIADWTPAQVAV